ncbi:sarcosine oxidase subunit gamma [Rhodovulum sp. ES.010]|uniref:sarcosine oxidase subunit gamma n=1 Tax=Rhodovulum sp. ES.010 TaxID=1882821 RepID=UPI0009286376|nr:sarcosine oxidase subunit gamma family protein [Rhodovulum sp. ES.010]SIO07871.1 sarcosine oxidase subunit gamma [Rhodovulum sp. ES.010]
MSEPVTALNGARAEGIATVEEAPARGMVTLRADLSARKVKSAVRKVAGVALPDPLAASWDGPRGAAWMAPDELLLFMPSPEAAETVEALEAALEGQHATAADVSDARAVFRVHGPGAREVLAKLTPADMAPDAFPEGRVRRTRLAQVPVAIWAETGGFGLVCFRSVAGYAFDLLKGAAAPGSAVGYFPDWA